MDTNVLKTFIAVCEYSGFSAAAKELGYTQSTVSSQIKQLEKEVEITENGTEQMFDKLRKNETDLVFTLDRHIYDSDFIICAEQEEQVHFIAAADNSVAGCSWKLSEISQNEFVLTEQAIASQSLEIRPVLEIGNPLQICELVKNSSLLSFLPDFISEKYVKDGQIKRLDVAGCPVTVWTQLLLHKNKWRSPAINVFVEFYKEVMQR